MNRREFSMQAASALGLGLAGAPLMASAQGGPVEGQNYTRLAQAAPVSAPAGKVEVVELDAAGPVLAGKHAHHQEQQQQRHAQACRHVAQQDAHEEQQAAGQQEVVGRFHMSWDDLPPRGHT